MEYTAIIKQEDDWWFGWVEEVSGVNCQEKTYDELIDTLKVTLKEAIDFSKQDARVSAGKGFEERIKGIITFLLVIMFERSSIYSQKGIWRKAAKGNRFVVQIGGLNVVEI